MMTSSSTHVRILGILGILMMSLCLQSPSQNSDLVSVNTMRTTTLAYTEHGPIVITSDGDFSAQGWPGEGTPESPYLIQGLNITHDGTCIDISHTRAYFQIQDCYISSLDDKAGLGISLRQTGNGTVEDCIIENGMVGIGMNDVVNMGFSENKVRFTSANGINVMDSNDLRFQSLDVHNCSDLGMYVLNVDNCTIYNSEFYYNNNTGLEVYECSNFTLDNNIAEMNGYDGIQVYLTSNCSIIKNQLIGNMRKGLYVSGPVPPISITENYAEGNGEGGFVVYDVYDCFIKNNVIKGEFLTKDIVTIGIEVLYSSNCTILNNSLSKHWSGIHSYESTDLRLVNNTFTDNFQGVRTQRTANCTIATNNFTGNTMKLGINLYTSLNFTIYKNKMLGQGFSFWGESPENFHHNLTQNTVNGKPVGYFWNVADTEIDGSPYGQMLLANCLKVNITGGSFENTSIAIQLAHCNDSRVISNSIQYSQSGISLYYSNRSIAFNNTLQYNNDGIIITRCNDMTLNENIVQFSEVDGIKSIFCYNLTLLQNNINWNGDDGIQIWNVTHSHIICNTASHNGWAGILVVQDCLDTLFRGNGIVDNAKYGIMNEQSKDLWFYENKIGWNGEANAIDNGQNNLWDDGISQGNFWSDYVASGTYSIPGSASSVDRYPSKLLEYNSPVITNPTDISYEAGSLGHVITWQAEDIEPASYLLYRNGSEIDTGKWNGSDIHVLVDGLDPGVYNYTIVFFDLSNNSASDIVYVTVVDTTAPTISSPDDIQFIEGSTGNVVTWTVDDFYPAEYEVFIDDTLVEETIWTGTSIEYTLDALSVGGHNVTILIYDTSGNFARDSVSVTVQAASSTSTTSGTTTTSSSDGIEALLPVIGASTVTVVLLIVAIIIYKRK